MTLGPLDLDLHRPAAIALGREAFVESFGSTERFDAELGADGWGVVPGLRVFERPLNEDVSAWHTTGCKQGSPGPARRVAWPDARSPSRAHPGRSS